VYQAILRNPLADPYLLGVSSGASLVSLLWYVGILSTRTALVIETGQQDIAFDGALAGVALVFLVATRRARIDPVTLILAGVIVNAVNGALYLLVFFTHPEIVARGGAVTFLVGGIQTNLARQQEWAAATAAGLGWLVLAYLSG